MGWRLFLGFIIGGIALIVFGAREMMLGRVAKSDPQEMTCAQLCNKGPGDNAHLGLSEFIPCTFSCIVKENKKRGTWSGAWVPLVPRDGEYARKIEKMMDANGDIQGDIPVPENVRVVAWVSQARDDADLSRLENTPRLQGMVINRISSLGSEERRLLEQAYPKSDFRTCYVFELDRRPMGTVGSIGMMAGGVAVMGLPVGFMVIRRRS